MTPYEIFKKGTVVEAHDEEGLLVSGTIMQQGTTFARITATDGESYDIPYGMLRTAGMKKIAALETIKEEEKDGNKFALVKEELNKDGVLAVVYKVMVNGKPVQTSEEIVMNVYDNEFGWSEPDDFDENKVELLKSTYESGFDLLVESYGNIEKTIKETPTDKPLAAPTPPEGKPAFAPGAKPTAPSAPSSGGSAPADIGAGAAETEKLEVAPEKGEAVTVDEKTVSTDAAAPAAAGEAVGASLTKTSFARSILASAADDRLHNNPQHRINPLLRQIMKDKHIDSGNTNDLQLADALKTYDFGDAAPKGTRKRAMDFSSITPVLEADNTLSDRELQRVLRLSIAAEEDAVSLYETIADSSDDVAVKKVLNSVASEEKIHIGELTQLLSELDTDNDDLLEQGRSEAQDNA